MDEVAVAAEYSKKTIYAYFSSKEQIYDAIICRAYQILNTLIAEAFQKSQPLNGHDKVILMGKKYLEFIETHPKYFEAMVYYDNRDEDLASDDPYKKANYDVGNKSADLLIQCILEGVHDGSISKNLDPVSAAFALYGNINGIGNIILRKEKYIFHTYHKTIAQLIAQAIELIEKSLKP